MYNISKEENTDNINTQIGQDVYTYKDGTIYSILYYMLYGVLIHYTFSTICFGVGRT